jgi:hypothetical protein
MSATRGSTLAEQDLTFMLKMTIKYKLRHVDQNMRITSKMIDPRVRVLRNGPSLIQCLKT